MAKWSAGDINVCAWSNASPTGGRFITMTIDRKYRSEQGWRSTHSFRPNDLPMIGALLQQAFNQLALRHQQIEISATESRPAPEAGMGPPLEEPGPDAYGPDAER